MTFESQKSLIEKQRIISDEYHKLIEEIKSEVPELKKFGIVGVYVYGRIADNIIWDDEEYAEKIIQFRDKNGKEIDDVYYRPRWTVLKGNVLYYLTEYYLVDDEYSLALRKILLTDKAVDEINIAMKYFDVKIKKGV